jgi:hypothetical protein
MMAMLILERGKRLCSGCIRVVAIVVLYAFMQNLMSDFKISISCTQYLPNIPILITPSFVV